jgi:lipopolysaccharide transport system ATP-binding protein
MNNVAIHMEGLGKEYRIGTRRIGGEEYTYRMLSETLTSALTFPIRKIGQLLHGANGDCGRPAEKIWALKDVSIEIKHGEVVGIIGRNGAGKSTMLKILSRITEPTTGFARIRGRVGSLLEVGTGFHPELTGRENIYLNGAILGMRKSEISRKFDEIVAFAEVEKFIDTPVKHYSSGMYLRLAFGVAAHMEQEILLVDEVLAVGDTRFQQKCLNKMQDVGKQGRTVLFVSHSMPAITRLCERTILLDSARVIKDGPSHEVINAYLNSGLDTTAAREWPKPDTAPGGDIARLFAVRVRTEGGEITDTVDIRQPIRVEMEYDILKPGYVIMPNFQFYNEESVLAFAVHDLDPNWRHRPRLRGRYISTTWIPGNFLSEGTIFVWAAMTTLGPVIPQFTERPAVAFHVIDSLDGDSARGDWGGRMKGAVRPLLKWTTEFTPHEGAAAPSRAAARP